MHIVTVGGHALTLQHTTMHVSCIVVHCNKEKGAGLFFCFHCNAMAAHSHEMSALMQQTKVYAALHHSEMA